MPTITSEKPDISATIASPRDRLPVVLWTVAVILAVAAACLRPDALLPAARATLGPFATLAAIIAGSVLAGRLGVFGALARFLIRGQAPRAVAAASVLAFTALLSGLVNLDVAVVVAMPAALEAARRHGLSAGRLAVAVAITANAASFLLPTSNITSLLLLGRTSLPGPAGPQGFRGEPGLGNRDPRVTARPALPIAPWKVSVLRLIVLPASAFVLAQVMPCRGGCRCRQNSPTEPVRPEAVVSGRRRPCSLRRGVRRRPVSGC